MEMNFLDRAKEFRPLYEFMWWGFELARRMVVRWYVTLACVVICLAGVVYYARSRPPVYLTTMKVIPASAITNPMRGDGGDAGGASIFGISLSSGVSGKMALYLALLQSPTIAQALVDKYHYDKKIFAGAIDPRTGEWKPTVARERDAFFDRLFGIEPPSRPSIRDVSAAINSMITLSTDTDKATGADTGAVIVSCRSSERVGCERLLTLLDKEAQAFLNRMSLEQTRKISEYLTREMPNVSEVEARTAMASLLANTQREIALSSLTEHDVAAVLEKPNAGELPTFPNPQTMLFMGFVLGLILGGAITWFTWSLEFSEIWGWTNNSQRHEYPSVET